jgi:hypothetical protein
MSRHDTTGWPPPFGCHSTMRTYVRVNERARSGQ